MLNVLSAKKRYGIQAVLDIRELGIWDGDRIGPIRRNGAGKSALLGVPSGRIVYNGGVVKRYYPIVEILQTGGTKDEPEIKLLNQLKLRNNAVRSRGEKTRCAVGAVFFNRAPLLFADEPTTNLDIEGVKLLEKMTKGYRGTILMVSHDRTLLGQVCNQVWELDRVAMRAFDDSYSNWVPRKERERGFQEFEYQQYQKERRRMERAADALQRKSRKVARPPRRMGNSEWVLCRGVAAFQQGHMQNSKSSVMSWLECLDKKDRPDKPPQVSMKLLDVGRIRAKNAATIRHPAVSYGNRIVPDDVSLEMGAGERTFITGNSGAGKSTLVRALMDRIPETFIAPEARVTYFSRDLDTLDPEKTVLENVVEDAAHPQHICRAALVSLYMIKDDMFEPTGVLPGGEKVRTALIKILISGCSFMILDEPANRMDVYTVGGPEHLLESYDGTLLAVSRNRASISHIGGMVCQLERGGIQKNTAQKVDTQYGGKY